MNDNSKPAQAELDTATLLTLISCDSLHLVNPHDGQRVGLSDDGRRSLIDCIAYYLFMTGIKPATVQARIESLGKARQ